MSKLDIKRIAAAACAAAMISTLSACGQNTTWGAEIDGAQVPAGVFISYLQSAYYEAEGKLSEQNEQNETVIDGDPAVTGAETTAPALFESQIEGVSAKQWIYDQATASMQEYIAVENKFEEYGLSISDEDKKIVDLYCEQFWDYYGETYTQMGISMDSFRAMQLNSTKRDMLFLHIYGQEGEKAVSDDELKTYLTENYAMINYIDMELKDGEGNLLKSEGKAERMAMAEDYIERFKAGEDLDILNAEYSDFYAELIAAATEVDMSEGETPLEEAEVDQSDAKADNPETEAAEADEAETEAETTVAETEATETETEAAETEAVSEAETEAETTAETAEATEAEEEESLESNKQVIGKDSSVPSAEAVKEVFESMNNGDIKVIESTDGEHYYIVAKLDILENEDYFTSAKESLLYEMKSDEFDELVKSWIESQSVTKNQEAYDRYDPEKIFAA